MTKQQLIDQLIGNLRAVTPDATEANWDHNRSIMEKMDIEILKVLAEDSYSTDEPLG